MAGEGCRQVIMAGGCFGQVMLAGVVIYKSISLREFYQSVVDSACSSAVVMLVVSFAGLFGWVIEIDGIVMDYSEALTTISQNPTIMLFVIMLVLLVAGMFMDAVTIMYITLPIFLPVARTLGIDLTWFGVLVMTSLSIGLITPPVGINLFVAANITRSSLGYISRGIGPFLIVSLIGLSILVLFPQISLFLL